jgi:hypothetical protein
MQSRDAHRATALKGPAAKAMSQGTIAKQERLLAEYAIRRVRIGDVSARQHAAKAAGYSDRQAKRIIDARKDLT